MTWVTMTWVTMTMADRGDDPRRPDHA